MCGIAGIISFRQNGDDMAANIAAMNAALRHRGPDDEGFALFHYKSVFLFHGDDSQEKTKTANIDSGIGTKAQLAMGHRRLSINDLTLAAHQPMCYKDRYWIIFNGEIYNYIELREELIAAGYTFTSHGDTEVILAAYDKWGVACLEKFNGMWAFVIYDIQIEQVFISRDRFGVKPLYYYKDKDVFVFASEIKAILRHPAVSTVPDMEYLQDYLQWGSKDYGQKTSFTNILRFNYGSYWQGSIQQLQAQTGLNEKKFWELKPAALTSEPFSEVKAEAYAAQYYSLLQDATRLRLRADVKVGSALSGGLDSSSIVYIVNQLLRKEGKTDLQQTFSTIYNSPDAKNIDESGFINELAKTFQLNSKQVEPNEKSAIEIHRKVIYHMDTPPDGSALAGWFTYRLTRQSGVTVTLDGQGADEQQAGYLLYLPQYFCHLPLSDLQTEYQQFSHIPGSKPFMLFGVVANIARRLGLRKLFLTLSRAMGISTDPFLTLNEALHTDIHHNLVSLLHFGDCNSMAHSVESRMPFMDYRLMEFWNSMPAIYKLHQGWTKYVARLAMNDKLPNSITWRKDKLGWPIPEEQWFRGSLKETVCRTVENSAFFKEHALAHNIRKRMESAEKIGDILRYYNVAVWYDVFFGSKR